MERNSVNSSNIAGIGYEPTSQLLEVAFHSGSVYQYSGVPVTIYEAFLTAGSHGKYFYSHIRDKYPDVKIR